VSASMTDVVAGAERVNELVRRTSAATVAPAGTPPPVAVTLAPTLTPWSEGQTTALRALASVQPAWVTGAETAEEVNDTVVEAGLMTCITVFEMLVRSPESPR